MLDDFKHYRVRASGAQINVRCKGDGPPLLLLHGYPQTHVMWHKIAPQLARDYTVVLPDLRGYGDSEKPRGDPGHVRYSKRAMAQDQVEVMAALGFDRFALVGHDRGARVAHRLALDYADRVSRIAVLDIVPTLEVFDTTDQALATAYFHWFFLIQPDGFPEHMIGADPEYYLDTRWARWGADPKAFTRAAKAEYLRCFRDPRCIHATCEDYRAGASIDLEHDRADPRKIGVPLLALWGSRGFVARRYDVLECWRRRAEDVSGRALDCGHFLPEEAPEETLAELRAFLASGRVESVAAAQEDTASPGALLPRASALTTSVVAAGQAASAPLAATEDDVHEAVAQEHELHDVDAPESDAEDEDADDGDPHDDDADDDEAPPDTVH